MFFHEKLNAILLCLNCTGAEISKKSGLDASLISRFRSGERIPKKGSSHLTALCNALACIAEEKGERDRLLSLAGCTKTVIPPLSDYLLDWFEVSEFDSLSKKKDNQALSKSKQSLMDFGKKLDVLMTTLSVSNICLARHINVDASLVSRLRSGNRIPRSDSFLVEGISRYLSNKAELDGQKKTLEDIIGLPKESSLFTSDRSLKDYIFHWLCDSKTELKIPSMSSFLDKLDSFDSETFNEEIDLNILKPGKAFWPDDEILSDETFFGREGFSKAILKLLLAATTTEKPRNIYIYLDQNLEWISEQQEFFQYVCSLMYTLIEKGFRFKIVHCLERKLSTMFTTIEAWFPLFLTDHIEIYYNKKTDSLFSHTYFIIDNLACVYSAFVTESEDTACYQFTSNKVMTKYIFTQFKLLNSYSSELTRIHAPENNDFYLLRSAELEDQCVELKTFINTLSFHTLSRTLLEKILLRAGETPETIDKILSYYDSRRSLFLEFLQERKIEEYYFFPTPEELTNGKVPIILPWFLLGKYYTYTTEEYFEHLAEIASLVQENKNYSLYPIAESPAKNIQIIVKIEPPTVTIRNSGSPTAFYFSSPIIYSAFNKYFDSFQKLCDREDLPSFIRNYTENYGQIDLYS